MCVNIFVVNYSEIDFFGNFIFQVTLFEMIFFLFPCMIILFFFFLQCWLCWFLNDGCEYANPKVAHVLCKGSSSSCTDFVWLLSFCCHWYHYSCHSNSTWSSQPQVTLTFLPWHSFFNHDNDITLYNVSCVNILSVFIFLALCGL